MNIRMNKFIDEFINKGPNECTQKNANATKRRGEGLESLAFPFLSNADKSHVI